MDFSHYFIKGLIVGIVIAVPVGPIGVLCIHRTLTKGHASGLLSGLGAATADALYGSIAAFGMTALSSFLLNHKPYFAILGGAFLVFLGLRMFLKQNTCEPANAKNNGLWTSYVSTLLLTLTNPATIIAFVAIFAGLGIVNGQRGFVDAAIVVLGVFLGSATWWIVLIGSASVFRVKFEPHWLVWVNRVAGGVITVFGFATVLATIFLRDGLASP